MKTSEVKKTSFNMQDSYACPAPPAEATNNLVNCRLFSGRPASAAVLLNDPKLTRMALLAEHPPSHSPQQLLLTIFISLEQYLHFRSLLTSRVTLRPKLLSDQRHFRLALVFRSGWRRSRELSGPQRWPRL